MIIKRTFFLRISLIALIFNSTSFLAQSQTWINDSVIMNPGYQTDCYYSLSNGTIKTDSNTNWHIGFSMLTPSSRVASIIANHNAGKVSVFPLHLSATNYFTTLSATDTVGKTSPDLQLYNSDTTWFTGALNQTRDLSQWYDYGWGGYNLSTHNVTGDSLFLLKIGVPSVDYKIWIKEFNGLSATWTFRIAKFDGTNDTTVTIPLANYNNKLFAFYNVFNNQLLDREPVQTDWDILFTRYKDSATQGTTTIMYNVTGVLSNNNVRVADVRSVSADSNFAHSAIYSNYLNTIGSDWKSFNGMNYDLDSTANYFIKTPNSPNKIWWLKFTKFAGSSSGLIKFMKTSIANLKINDVQSSLNSYAIAPNPAANIAHLILDAKENSEINTTILDLSGKIVYQNSVIINRGMNVINLPIDHLKNGNYFISIGNKNWKLTNKISVLN